MSECGLALRQLGKQAESMEVAGKEIVQHLYKHLIDHQTCTKTCTLIQLFKTHSYNGLTQNLKAAVQQQLGHTDIAPSLKCWTLLATAGDQPDWNSRHDVSEPQIIPLTDATAIANTPLIAQLLAQLGLEPGTILQSDHSPMAPTEPPLDNVFLIPAAGTGLYLPAHAKMADSVKSIVVFGGVLPSGDLFAVILYLKVVISRATVDLIRPLALSVKAAILPFDQDNVFGDSPPDHFQPGNSDAGLDVASRDRTIKQLRAQVATLTQLLNVSEQATLSQSDRLEKTVADLKQALKQLQKTRTQMVHSEKMSSLGQMVAGVAHEINNPVNFIFGNITHAIEYTEEIFDLLELYRRYCPEAVPAIQAKIDEMDLDFVIGDLTKLLSSMKMGAERIREIVRSLRIFSRLDEAEFKPANIHEGLNSTLLILQHRFKTQPHRTEIQIVKDYGDIPYIDCYPGQLNQVFMNILSNAIDALDERATQELAKLDTAEFDRATAGQISIRTHMLNEDWIRICIADNGTGMSATTRTKLFDPFFTTKPVGKGTGLGLSISYQIVVEKHGGKLVCHSEPGQGAEFMIDLPIWKQPAIANQTSVNVTSPDLVIC